ncbi:M14 family metallopeptidase [Fulvivirga ligni]|uniref:M14 family metallopeptidase n=1 Tax=Fulvivirga ligni TaxID=2904246 RepID=UPI001F162A09|nr:M14 family metallopeptidase [Fulvivirga ligni]UII22771.1 M14 family metallopeptidase [Fulvivirga ligni]
MKTISTLLVTILVAIVCNGQSLDLNYYFSPSVNFLTHVPTPKSVIGYEVGEQHVSHDKLVQYMQLLSESSDRITHINYGESNEHRPLMALFITSPENHKNLETLRNQHVDYALGKSSEKSPLVVYMGYSIHGNEASGSNAALLAAYYLAAAQGEEINRLLENTIIILDPSFNPDGLQRFANWTNSRTGYTMNPDPQNIEQNEPWPNGRTNHYWFDLNRDWLTAQQPESQGRVALFQKWKPNILTDHHEMGSNATFFFQPGIPSRNNPLIPEITYNLTHKIAEYHASALDSIGSLYYTKENYDDFYFGKGSTYPDIQGGIGILFEQASSRAYAQNTEHGVLKFPFTVKNHLNTTLSTLKAALSLKDELISYQRNFYTKENTSPVKAYVFASKDQHRNYHLAELINRHDIAVYHSKDDRKVNGTSFKANEIYVIPTSQPQQTLIQTIFEKNLSYEDSLFYDVSAWTMPLAFGVKYEEVNKNIPSSSLGKKYSPDQKPQGSIIGGVSEYGYIFEWTDYYSPKILYKLLNKGYNLKVATDFFSTSSYDFKRGAIFIPVTLQNISSSIIYGQLEQIASEEGINIHAVHSGLNFNGVSLGSPSFETIHKPKIAMLIGSGISSYDAGEIWHLLDKRFEIPVSLIDKDHFNRVNLNSYNTLIMPDGTYSELNNTTIENLKSWIKAGGTIIATEKSLSYLAGLGLGKFDFKPSDNEKPEGSLSYAKMERYKGAQQIGGAIFNTKVDLTHPLLYGYENENVPVFKRNRLFLNPSNNPFANPISFTEAPLLSGYISKPNLDKVGGSSVVGISHYGKGCIIGFTEDLNFRAFWYGTNKIFLNAIFFAPLIDRGADR